MPTPWDAVVTEEATPKSRLTMFLNEDDIHRVVYLMERLRFSTKVSCFRYALKVYVNLLLQRQKLEKGFPEAEIGTHQLYWMLDESFQKARVPTYQPHLLSKKSARLTLDFDRDDYVRLDTLKRFMGGSPKNHCLRHAVILLASLVQQRDELQEEGPDLDIQLCWVRGKTAKRAVLPAPR